MDVLEDPWLILLMAVPEFLNTDPLTGIGNRRAFMAMGNQLLASNESANRLALLVMDLDHFKQVNDQHGHHLGDLALQAFSQHCLDQLRDRDYLARLGGEEFGILLPAVDLPGAREVAERIRNSLETLEIHPDHTTLRLNVSIGVAMAAGCKDLEALLRRADQALYRAKEAGRNRVETAADLVSSVPG